MVTTNVSEVMDGPLHGNSVIEYSSDRITIQALGSDGDTQAMETINLRSRSVVETDKE